MLAPARRKYSLDDLIAQCDMKTFFPEDMAAWSEVKPVGREAW
nr:MULTISPECIES: hypothetical protein [Mycetohabitans]